MGVWETHLSSLALCFFCGKSSRKGAGPSAFLPCTSLALMFCKEGRRHVYPFLSHAPWPSPASHCPRLSTQHWSSPEARWVPEGAAYPGEAFSNVTVSKAAQVRLYCMVSRVLSFRRPSGRAGQCAAAQPPRLGPCGVTPNPRRQRGGEGGERRPTRRVKRRWIPGRTKALRDLRIPDKPRGKPPGCWRFGDGRH